MRENKEDQKLLFYTHRKYIIITNNCLSNLCMNIFLSFLKRERAATE